MTLRNQRQNEFADKWIREGENGILNLFVRFGKIRTSINIFKKINASNILISYPDNKIKQSWIDEFKELEFDYSEVTFTNHRSLNKYIEDIFDIVVLDEVHTLSDVQIKIVKEMKLANPKILGLTGTLSKWTERTLKYELGLKPIVKYEVDQAIEEGVVSDYEIFIIEVPMDNTVIQNFGKSKKSTESKRLSSLKWVCDKLEQEEKNNFFMKLKIMDIFQNSLAKKRKVQSLLMKHKTERVLVFCGSKRFSEDLGIPYHHSSSNNAPEFVDFASGKGNHMAVIRIGSSGVTFKPLNLVIINAIDSNPENMTQKIGRCLAIENNNPDKKSKIYIPVTPNSLEDEWLQKSLVFFDKKKIHRLK